MGLTSLWNQLATPKVREITPQGTCAGANGWRPTTSSSTPKVPKFSFEEDILENFELVLTANVIEPLLCSPKHTIHDETKSRPNSRAFSISSENIKPKSVRTRRKSLFGRAKKDAETAVLPAVPALPGSRRDSRVEALMVDREALPAKSVPVATDVNAFPAFDPAVVRSVEDISGPLYTNFEAIVSAEQESNTKATSKNRSESTMAMNTEPGRRPSSFIGNAPIVDDHPSPLRSPPASRSVVRRLEIEKAELVNPDQAWRDMSRVEDDSQPSTGTRTRRKSWLARTTSGELQKARPRLQMPPSIESERSVSAADFPKVPSGTQRQLPTRLENQGGRLGKNRKGLSILIKNPGSESDRPQPLSDLVQGNAFTRPSTSTTCTVATPLGSDPSLSKRKSSRSLKASPATPSTTARRRSSSWWSNSNPDVEDEDGYFISVPPVPTLTRDSLQTTGSGSPGVWVNDPKQLISPTYINVRGDELQHPSPVSPISASAVPYNPQPGPKAFVTPATEVIPHVYQPRRGAHNSHSLTDRSANRESDFICLSEEQQQEWDKLKRLMEGIEPKLDRIGVPQMKAGVSDQESASEYEANARTCSALEVGVAR